MATRDLNSKAEYKYKINNVIYLHIRVIHAKFFHVIYSSYSKANKSDVITKKNRSFLGAPRLRERATRKFNFEFAWKNYKK